MMIKFVSPRQLAAYGILGINKRNRDYIATYNDRRLYPIVDNKLKTKLKCEEYHIATPKLRYVLSAQHEVRKVVRKLMRHQSFVIKPAKGSGGKGILVIADRDGDSFVKPSGSKLSASDVNRHMSNVLAGLYSLGGNPDTILIEDMVVSEETLSNYSYQGVPDIRVIVFQGFPVMAMTRLATQASDGKANLHQGAVGVGLDLETGKSLNAVQFSRHVTHHPDNDATLKKLQIADWKHLLEIAAGCYEMTGLGYLGVDMVVDETHGALLLELNARPGLAIQISNNSGLLPRLKYIEALENPSMPTAERVALARAEFGNQVGWNAA